jgi:hypothetical protein
MKCKLTFAMVFQVGKALAERCVSGSKRKSWEYRASKFFEGTHLFWTQKNFVTSPFTFRFGWRFARPKSPTLPRLCPAVPCPMRSCRTVHKTCTFWNNSLRNYIWNSWVKHAWKNWLSILWHLDMENYIPVNWVESKWKLKTNCLLATFYRSCLELREVRKNILSIQP